MKEITRERNLETSKQGINFKYKVCKFAANNLINCVLREILTDIRQVYAWEATRGIVTCE